MKKALREEKGMMTVEVIIGLTIYVVFLVLMMNLLNVIYIKQKFQAAMNPVAVKLSREYYVDTIVAEDGVGYEKVMLDELMQRRGQGYVNLSGDFTSKENLRYAAIAKAEKMLFMLTADFKTVGYASSDAYADMWIVGGYDGISFDGTRIDENGSGELELVIEYRIRIANLPLFGGTGLYIPVKQTASTKIWE
ncbi:MAG: hypothetical protein IJX85_04730 [Lachnospiraceae bacterium]|nr:hypothetical protein [Lachnospiraceae bacterium]